MSRLRTAVAAALLAAAASFPLAGTAFAQDRDCGDFSTQEEAQAVYEQDTGDPHRLDADDDGIACESLPSGNSTGDDTTGSDDFSGDSATTGSEGQVDLDCSDFATQQEAQAVYEQGTGDPHRLDADDDGIACESLSNGDSTGDDTTGSDDSSGDSATTGDSQVEEVPEGAVDTGDGSAADNGGLGYLLAGLAVAMAGGVATAVGRAVPQER